MTPSISVTFNNITPAMAHRLNELYAEMTGQHGALILERIASTAEAIPTPPPPPRVEAPAPAAAPSSGSEPAIAPALSAAAGTTLDNRGVPWHPDHHSGTASAPGTNEDGTWKKRRGHNKDALKAYEAQFLGKGKHAANGAATPVPPSGANTAASPASGANGVPLPPPPPPPPTTNRDGLVTITQLQDLWADLCKRNKVTSELKDWIANNHGGNISDGVNNVFAFDAPRRQAVYEMLLPWAA